MADLFQEKPSQTRTNGTFSGDSSDELTDADKALAQMGYVPVSCYRALRSSAYVFLGYRGRMVPYLT